jgi:hypothetical protein
MHEFQTYNYSRLSYYKRRIVGGLVSDQIMSWPLDTQAPDQGNGLTAEHKGTIKHHINSNTAISIDCQSSPANRSMVGISSTTKRAVSIEKLNNSFKHHAREEPTIISNCWSASRAFSTVGSSWVEGKSNSWTIDHESDIRMVSLTLTTSSKIDQRKCAWRNFIWSRSYEVNMSHPI